MSFGDESFGETSFGSAEWAEQVLYESLPGTYRQLDEENDFQLRSWASVIAGPFETARSLIESWENLRDARRVQTRRQITRSIRLGSIREPESVPEQRGIDGTIVAGRLFFSPTARFRAEDAGKPFTISESGLPANNQDYVVATVVNTTTVALDPAPIVDPVPFRWEIRSVPSIPEGEIILEVTSGDLSGVYPGWTLFDGFSELRVLAKSLFFADGSRSLTEREGAKGEALSDGRFQAEIEFAQTDVGKPFTVDGSSFAVNNGKAEIKAVDPTDLSIVTLHEPLSVPSASPDGEVVYELQPGNRGVSVSHQNLGVSQPLAVAVVDAHIQVFLATNGSGAVTSTANAVAAAVNADLDASALLTATPGGLGTGVVAELAETPLQGVSLAEDATPLFWAKLPFPTVTLASSAPPEGYVRQRGVDLEVSGLVSNRLTMLTARFTADDVGGLVTIRGSQLGSDGVYEVLTVIDSTSITVSAPVTLAAETDLYWSLRTPSGLPDITRVELFAPSRIELLAADLDLGSSLDAEEDEANQRTWVETATQWMDLKGSQRGYAIVGAASGLQVTPIPLFRISRGVSTGLPPANVFNLTENREGSDGKLVLQGGSICFVSETADFTPTDAAIRLCLSFSNCVDANNVGIFEIYEWVDASTVRMRPLDALFADTGIGGTAENPTIEWELSRLYADQPPLRPHYDEVNVELMQDIVGASNFLMDSYCWQSDFTTSFTIEITAVTPGVSQVSPGFYEIELTGIMQGTGNYSTAAVIGIASSWQITDVASKTYFVESMPVEVSVGPPPVHTLKVFATEPPALGVASLRYLCSLDLSCDYCQSSTVIFLTEPL